MTNVPHPGGGCNDDIALAPIDTEAALRFHWVRTICGVEVGPECLPPDVEAEAWQAFRALANYLELATFRARQKKRGAA
jgi:hypothetical protein